MVWNKIQKLFLQMGTTINMRTFSLLTNFVWATDLWMFICFSKLEKGVVKAAHAESHEPSFGSLFRHFISVPWRRKEAERHRVNHQSLKDIPH